MKKNNILLLTLFVIPIAQASLAPSNKVPVTKITNYIDTFCLVRPLTDGLKSDIILKTHELYNAIPFLPADLLKNIVFEETNASEKEKEFFNEFLHPNLHEHSYTDTSEEEWYSIEECSSDNPSESFEQIFVEDRYKRLQEDNLENNLKYIDSFNKQNKSQFIPTPLCNSLHNRPFIQIIGQRQNGISCGYWTLAHTKALSEQLEYNTTVDLAALYTRSQEVFNEIINGDPILEEVYEREETAFHLLNTDWAIELAEKINLDAYTMFNYQIGSGINIYAEKITNQDVIAIKEDDVLKRDYQFDYDTFNFLQNMKINFHETILNKIKNNKSSYFLFCSGTHWTSFTIAKNDTGLAYLIFINSASPDTICYDLQTTNAFEGITEFNGQIDEDSKEYICANALLEVIEYYNQEIF